MEITILSSSDFAAAAETIAITVDESRGPVLHDESPGQLHESHGQRRQEGKSQQSQRRQREMSEGFLFLSLPLLLFFAFSA
jgi:hypothetical protein